MHIGPARKTGRASNMHRPAAGNELGSRSKNNGYHPRIISGTGSRFRVGYPGQTRDARLSARIVSNLLQDISGNIVRLRRRNTCFTGNRICQDRLDLIQNFTVLNTIGQIVPGHTISARTLYKITNIEIEAIVFTQSLFHFSTSYALVSVS